MLTLSCSLTHIITHLEIKKLQDARFFIRKRQNMYKYITIYVIHEYIWCTSCEFVVLYQPQDRPRFTQCICLTICGFTRASSVMEYLTAAGNFSFQSSAFVDRVAEALFHCAVCFQPVVWHVSEHARQLWPQRGRPRLSKEPIVQTVL